MREIALMVETSRAYGRSMIEGIAAFAQKRRDWRLRPLAVEAAFSPKVKEFDGVIARIADDRLAERLRRVGIPTVDVFCQKTYPSIAGVDSDHASIGRLARTFFLSRGFRNLAYCGLPGVAFSDAREKAFADDSTLVYAPKVRKAVDDSQFYAERVDRIPDATQLRKWARHLPKPVAVFCCNDLRAIQLQQLVREIGLRVPEDVALLGVDNDTIACSFAEVPISSIEPNSRQVGYDAARILLALMNRPPAARPHRIRRVRPGDILERASTEFMPIDPPWLGAALLHIERNLSRSIGAREIFALSGLSSTSVENAFRAKLGQSVQAYVTSVKLREARRLLADPSLRISEIAYRCGFASPAYFCRTFVAAVGQSPRAYRNHLCRDVSHEASRNLTET